ncbi:MAG: hypothetical protein L6R39_002165 [Caloplaca ligustica]|nr:MAG: hypothetical protein L6R39_002165 [Caloplaca ligustica]
MASLSFPSLLPRYYDNILVTTLTIQLPQPPASISWITSTNIRFTVSWAYGGGRPGGEVAEKKDEGEIAIQSKRGNTIKRNADPDNPAVHITRPGNDVVKRQSELDVEEKTAEGGDQGAGNAGDDAAASAEAEKPEDKTEGALDIPEANGQHREKSKSPAPKKTPGPKKSSGPKKSPAPKEPAASKKRKATEEAEEEAEEQQPSAKKARGRPKGSGNAAKAAKVAEPAKEKKTLGRKPGAPKKVAAPKETPAPADPAKKQRGRPKGSGAKTNGATAKKEKKTPAQAVNGTVGSRTRSTKK